MTRQQQAYRELCIYRLRVDAGRCPQTGLRFAVVTTGASLPPKSLRVRVLEHYVMCTN